MLPPDAQPKSTYEETLERAEVVLVAYRSHHHVAALLKNWPASLSVVVVDNSADADDLSTLVAQYPNVRYVDGGGQGFARGANAGALSSTKEFVIFVNPDCRPLPRDLAALVAGLANDHSALVHAATMTAATGEVEMGVGGWEPSLPRIVLHSLGLYKRWSRSGLFAHPQLGEHINVDWTTGACMCVRAAQFKDIGGFDETFYVYAEDIGLGRSGNALGLRSVLREDVVVTHGAGSSGAPSAEMLRLRGASFAGYLSKYHAGGTAVTMRAVMAAGSVLRATLSALRRDTDNARLSFAFVQGLLTRRAYVGGAEVAASRFAEVVPAQRHPRSARRRRSSHC